ncbi:uncharacterized protein LOC132257409 isoform X2 [Phlebotomus argentipes]|uniref:uncharacterized protein LOC132257409 isoform X2 n=1 Tax=Phlebotomus argentipes TaxID=94469 RepID=UPI002893069D|nr:uncharacterized protein LOC132257409 isoform X2 [Phlebotomus argentipes]
MFNFHLNWDLHMTQCKPCGPRSAGNILTRRLCRNRRRDDNELYRSNSFKFERFDRKEGQEVGGSETLPKQISICDDYSLPVDFVKKRPSSFDPCLVDLVPNNWTTPSPLSEHVTFADPGNPAKATLTPQPAPQPPVKVVEGYSNPKDSKRQHRTGRREQSKRPTSLGNFKPYNRLCSDSDSAGPKTSADEEEEAGAEKPDRVPDLNSPDSISEDLVRPLQPQKSPKRFTGTSETSKRNPSPYYYSDLLKARDSSEGGQKSRQHRSLRSKTVDSRSSGQSGERSATQFHKYYKKSSSLDVPCAEREEEEPQKRRYSITEDGVRIIRCESPSTTTSDDSDCTECQKRREWHAQALALVRETCNVVAVQDSSMPPHRLLGPAMCACTAALTATDDPDDLFRPRSIFYVHQVGEQECADCGEKPASEKATESGGSGKTRQIYETAFDSKVTRSDDDLDDNLDRLTSHSMLASTPQTVDTPKSCPKEGKERSRKSSKSSEAKRHSRGKSHSSKEKEGSGSTISQEMENMHLMENSANANEAGLAAQLPLRGYTPSPPSTAPLPVKFPGKHERFLMNSIKSAPNLPSTNPPKNARLKDLHLPLKSLCPRDPPASSEGSIGDTRSYNSPRNAERPRSVVLESGRVLELKGSHHGTGQRQRRGGNFSSTESMVTSSSGGSMESIRSSTSEGNRSTSSSESRHSTSLSSHSSDSGPGGTNPLRVPIVIHSKLHILSPISDKSSQEPGSETSDINNRNNNSQKASPDDGTKQNQNEDFTTDNAAAKMKRRIPQNKTLLLITDSGISLHSRDGAKSRISAFQPLTVNKFNPTIEKVDNNVAPADLPQDFSDLPFDMPKLRRRRIITQPDACTSGSATSVDLGDLPFDMPKLRRRVRLTPQPACGVSGVIQTSTESSGVSQASSSHSVREDKPILGTGMFRQNLTLNLMETKAASGKKCLGGSLELKSSGKGLLNLNLGAYSAGLDLIDATVPLERQGWYHGAISRVEAECTLRPLNEGSFLVRNSESTRQDYSLSLKSAKGFMHMRIQKNDAGQYILGQFSRPFDSIPEMIRHFCLNRLPIRGAEHMVLLEPVIAQLL